MASEEIVIYTDGAARGNPGPSASGYIVLSGGRLMAQDYRYNGERTNNYAEYTAIIMALERCLSGFGETKSLSLRVVSDSKLVINQLRGEYRVRAGSLRALNRKAVALCSRFGRIRFESRPREDGLISRVDRELNRLLDAREREKE